MNVVILVALIFVSYVGSKIFGKLCSDIIIGGSVASYALYFLFNGVVACIFFFISAGFKISLNLPTTIYSAVFALVVVMSIVGLLAYKFADVSSVTIITSACALVATSSLGAFIFNENVGILTLIRILIMLVAVVLTFLDTNKRTTKLKGGSKSKRKILPLVLIIIAVTLSNAASTIITKFYSLDKNVTDENSFFFFTNVFLIIFSAIAFLVDSISCRRHFKDAIKLLNPQKAVALIGNTICSNISSLVGILLIAVIDVSVYSPFTSALGIISGVIVSALFREKLGVLSYLAAIVACVSVFI